MHEILLINIKNSPHFKYILNRENVPYKYVKCGYETIQLTGYESSLLGKLERNGRGFKTNGVWVEWCKDAFFTLSDPNLLLLYTTRNQSSRAFAPTLLSRRLFFYLWLEEVFVSSIHAGVRMRKDRFEDHYPLVELSTTET